MRKNLIVISLILVVLFLTAEIFIKKHNGQELGKAADTEYSIDKLLKKAREPIGKTMYVWGGGWNEEDSGAGVEAVTLGVSRSWEKFALKQDKNYDFEKTRYQNHEGLDCSGYIGWVVYNLLETENGKEGYVVNAAKMAKFLSEKGLGEYTENSKVKEWQAGDIMSMEGHTWLSLGSCEDGSVVIMHACPPGVTLSGTLLPDGGESMAVKLAKKYMYTYYPEWYEKYSVKPCEYKYLTDSDRFRWGEEIADGYGLRKATAGEVLAWLFH